MPGLALILRACGARCWTAILPGAQLELASLDGANFVAATLKAASFRGATLRGANLSRADLEGATLDSCDLLGADFSEANLVNASLRGARLDQANFGRAVLDGADFSESVLHYTSFGGVDFSRSRGLESIKHSGPSMVGIDTVYLSKGAIPEKFLRGAGVPDQFVKYMKSLVANPIEFYSCFISYSSKDAEFAERLHSDLQNKNVRCWFAPHDIQGGQKLHEQIDQAIRVHEKLLLILSPHSMESEWVKTEIAKARKRELREKKSVLFPVRVVPFEMLRDWECFDADSGKDSAREIREYFIPDFSNWKDHDAYKDAFLRLLRDLKAETN